MLIQDGDQFQIPSFCRSLDYYVDPSSKEILELGTKQYPYRTFAPVASEILMQHSHQDVVINIYIMENTNVFLEDSLINFINITRVILTSYNTEGAPAGMATLTTTDASVDSISKKAGFHIMKNITFDKESVVADGNFTDYELGLIGRTGDTIHLSRTSLEISKMKIHRVAESTLSGNFLFLLYLQDRNLTIVDTEFYLTGGLLLTQNSVNVHFENLYVDTYLLNSGFVFLTL